MLHEEYGSRFYPRKVSGRKIGKERKMLGVKCAKCSQHLYPRKIHEKKKEIKSGKRKVWDKYQAACGLVAHLCCLEPLSTHFDPVIYQPKREGRTAV